MIGQTYMRNLLLLSLVLVACTKKPATPLSPVEEGKKLYATHCTACHSPNPKIDGALGPAVFGSTLDLLDRRLVHGDYPAGYSPKRSTKVMVRLPFLKDQIPNLHAYLNNP